MHFVSTLVYICACCDMMDAAGFTDEKCKCARKDFKDFVCFAMVFIPAFNGFHGFRAFLCIEQDTTRGETFQE